MAISDDVTMFFGAKPEIFEKAVILRENMTTEEKLLWDNLRERNVFKYKFRRQHPIDIFVVDFYCHPLLLVIEVDGGYHLNSDQNQYDLRRKAELENWGIKVIRFTNEQVQKSIEIVTKKIKEVIKQREKELQL